MIKVSPNITQDQLDSGEKTMLDVYDDIVKHCVFDPAGMIVGSEHSGFAVLMLVTSIFETLGRITIGDPNKDDRSCFVKGFMYVFSKISEDTAKRVYYFLRC